MFTETSAKVGINVKQLFIDLAQKLPGVDSTRNAANDPQAEARMGGQGGVEGTDGGSAAKPSFKIGGTSGAAQQQRADNQANTGGGSGKKCC